MKWMSSFILFFFAMMILAGLGMTIDAGIDLFEVLRVRDQPDRR